MAPLLQLNTGAYFPLRFLLPDYAFLTLLPALRRLPRTSWLLPPLPRPVASRFPHSTSPFPAHCIFTESRPPKL